MASPQGHARLLPSASRQRRGVARARAASATSCFHLGAPILPSSPPWTPLCLSPLLSALAPSSNPLSRAQTSVAIAAACCHRAHRARLASPPWQKDPPSTSPPSPLSHATGCAPQWLPRPLLQPSGPEITGDPALDSLPPRALRGHRCTRRELLSLLPLATSLELPSNPVGHHGRELGSAGHVAAVATGA